MTSLCAGMLAAIAAAWWPASKRDSCSPLWPLAAAQPNAPAQALPEDVAALCAERMAAAAAASPDDRRAFRLVNRAACQLTNRHVTRLTARGLQQVDALAAAAAAANHFPALNRLHIQLDDDSNAAQVTAVVTLMQTLPKLKSLTALHLQLPLPGVFKFAGSAQRHLAAALPNLLALSLSAVSEEDVPRMGAFAAHFKGLQALRLHAPVTRLGLGMPSELLGSDLTRCLTNGDWSELQVRGRMRHGCCSSDTVHADCDARLR